VAITSSYMMEKSGFGRWSLIKECLLQKIQFKPPVEFFLSLSKLHFYFNVGRVLFS
jgi:hypothetical protein